MANAKQASLGPKATLKILNNHAEKIDALEAHNALELGRDAGTVKRFFVIENGILDVHEFRTVKVEANV